MSELFSHNFSLRVRVYTCEGWTQTTSQKSASNEYLTGADKNKPSSRIKEMMKRK